MSGFRQFLMRGNIIDLAAAVVVGVAFNAIVQALVKDLITPLIAILINNRFNFNDLAYYHGHTKFEYGSVINAAVSFLVIAAVVYWLIVAPAEKMTALANRNKAATDRPCPECLSVIPIAAKRCMYCTSEVPPVPPPSNPAPAWRPRGGFLARGLLPLRQRSKDQPDESTESHLASE
jgi:large conductance mechanosensitive channel